MLMNSKVSLEKQGRRRRRTRLGCHLLAGTSAYHYKARADRVLSALCRQAALAHEIHRFHHAEPFLAEHVTEQAADMSNVSRQLGVPLD